MFLRLNSACTVRSMRSVSSRPRCSSFSSAASVPRRRAQGKRPAATCPVLQAGGRALTREGADLAVDGAADVARVDDDDLARAARLGVTGQVQHEPAVLEGCVVRQDGVALHELEQSLLQLHVLAEGRLAVAVRRGHRGPREQRRWRHGPASCRYRRTGRRPLGCARATGSRGCADAPRRSDRTARGSDRPA